MATKEACELDEMSDDRVVLYGRNKFTDEDLANPESLEPNSMPIMGLLVLHMKVFKGLFQKSSTQTLPV